MELSAKIVIYQKSHLIFSAVIYFCKSYILDVLLGSESASGSRKFGKYFVVKARPDLISMNYTWTISLDLSWWRYFEFEVNLQCYNDWLLKAHMSICWLRIRSNRSIPYQYLNNFQVAYSKSFESVVLPFQFKFVPNFLWHLPIFQFQFIIYIYKSKILNLPSSIKLALLKRSIKLLHY